MSIHLSDSRSGALPIVPRRVAGLTIPLFTLRTRRSWGIGEIGDLGDLAEWVRDAGIRLVQTLPLGEIAWDETSPYSALSAFGIDPMYISVADVPDAGPDVEPLLGTDGARLLAKAQASPAVDYQTVRPLKRKALRACFERFRQREMARSSPRAQLFQAFRRHSGDWLDDYALFRALREAHGDAGWARWPEPLRRAEPRALAHAAELYRDEILFHAYLQWLAHTQWYDARARLGALGVELMGDLPFVVAWDSCDVWAHQAEFLEGFSVGAPPDAFDPEGQDWDLPPYRWERMRANDFAWLRRRARYAATLFDRFRVDHVVGLYRTYVRPRKALDAGGRRLPGVFDPATPAEQLAHGERVMRAMQEAAAEGGTSLIAEDLGVIPHFVRESMSRLGVPGYKVLIWERYHNVFSNPMTFPALSVACFGTHDTEPVAVWWEGLGRDEREAVRAIPLLAPLAKDLGPELTPVVHAALVDLLHAAGSDLVLFLIQDLLGVRDRINVPSTIGPHNWTYRLPAPVEDLRRDGRVNEILAMFRRGAEKAGRLGD